MVRYMLLSCPAKKVTKECGIGEALRKCALSYVPLPPHRQLCFRKSRFRDLRFLKIYTSDKNRNIFCPKRMYVKVLQRCHCCATGWVHREGRLWRAGARHSAPSLCRLLLVLFLAKQEKYIPAPTSKKTPSVFDNLHLSSKSRH